MRIIHDSYIQRNKETDTSYKMRTRTNYLTIRHCNSIVVYIIYTHVNTRYEDLVQVSAGQTVDKCNLDSCVAIQ